MLFSERWLRNHPQFLLLFLMHIDVLMLHRKFELIPTNNFSSHHFATLQAYSMSVSIYNQYYQTPSYLYKTLYHSTIGTPIFLFHLIKELGSTIISTIKSISIIVVLINSSNLTVPPNTARHHIRKEFFFS